MLEGGVGDQLEAAGAESGAELFRGQLFEFGGLGQEIRLLPGTEEGPDVKLAGAGVAGPIGSGNDASSSARGMKPPSCRTPPGAHGVGARVSAPQPYRVRRSDRARRSRLTVSREGEVVVVLLHLSLGERSRQLQRSPSPFDTC